VAGLEAPAPTGVLFGEQSASAVARAVRGFEQNGQRISVQACRARAEQFSAERFRAEFMGFVTKKYAQWSQRR
jgi:hypothetical protein